MASLISTVTGSAIAASSSRREESDDDDGVVDTRIDVERETSGAVVGGRGWRGCGGYIGVL